MANGNFGRLERVRNIREHWPREDTDFTPWLASEESIVVLSDAIGIELEVLEQERSIGPFRADILCKNTADNSIVLIENQFGRTDHSHLGQLFTYAAGLDAVTLIWIVEKFTEEHRAAIDWLNRITDEKFYFFGIEIELWTIGDSPPAPKFNIVSKPNDWAKTVRETAEVSRSKMTPWQESQVTFWKKFGDHIQEVNAPFKPPKPYSSLWMGYGIGRSYTNMVVGFSQKDIMVYVQIDTQERPGWFEELMQQKESIDGEFGETIRWDGRESLRHKRAIVSRPVDMTDEQNWDSAIEWMLDRMKRMKDVFKPRVMSLSENAVATEIE
jgi:hypothetical protein